VIEPKLGPAVITVKVPDTGKDHPVRGGPFLLFRG